MTLIHSFPSKSPGNKPLPFRLWFAVATVLFFALEISVADLKSEIMADPIRSFYDLSNRFLYGTILNKDFCTVDVRRNLKLQQTVLTAICEKTGLKEEYVCRDRTMPPLISKLYSIHRDATRARRKGTFALYSLVDRYSATTYRLTVVFDRPVIVTPQPPPRPSSSNATPDRQTSERLVLSDVNGRFGTNVRKARPVYVLGGKRYSPSQIRKQHHGLARALRRVCPVLCKPGQRILSVTYQNAEDRVKTIPIENPDQPATVPQNVIASVARFKDTYLVPDKVYHELAMMIPNLPRSYQVKKYLQSMNDDSVTPSDGPAHGVQQNFRSSLELRIRECSGAFDAENPIVKVKLSGDGTQIGKRMGSVIVGYTLLTPVLHGSDVSCLGVVKCEEKYAELKENFGSIFESAENLKRIEVDGVMYEIEYFFTADMKFLNIVLGLDAPNCKFACYACHCSSLQRSDFSTAWPLDDGEHSRTIEKIVANSSLRKSDPGKYNCSNLPLIQFIPINRIVPDILHLMLRITDNLLQKFVAELRRLDNVSRTAPSFDPNSHHHLAKFQQFARNVARVHLDIRIDSATKKLAITDLPVNQRMRLMRLCDVASFLSESEIDGAKVKYLWEEFLDIYDVLRDYRKSLIVDLGQLQRRITHWCKLYCHDLYLASDATPYVHIFFAHVVDYMALHGPICIFSQQRFEQNNHVFTKSFFRSSNYGSSALEQVLRKQQRLLRFRRSVVSRVKRKYACSFCSVIGHSRVKCPNRLSAIANSFW